MIDRDTNDPPKTDFNKVYRNVRPRRVRLAVIADQSQEAIQAFVRANIAPGTTLLTDGHSSYWGLSAGDEATRYVLNQRVVGKMAAHLTLY